MGLLQYSYEEIIKKVKKLGYTCRRNGKGSHEVWEHVTHTTIIVTRHGSKSLSQGVVKKIIKSTGLTNKEFANL